MHSFVSVARRHYIMARCHVRHTTVLPFSLTRHRLSPPPPPPPPPPSHLSPITQPPLLPHLASQRQTGRPILIMKGGAIVPQVYEGHKDAGTTIAVRAMMRLGRAPDHSSVAKDEGSVVPAGRGGHFPRKRFESGVSQGLTGRLPYYRAWAGSL